MRGEYLADIFRDIIRVWSPVAQNRSALHLHVVNPVLASRERDIDIPDSRRIIRMVEEIPSCRCVKRSGLSAESNRYSFRAVRFYPELKSMLLSLLHTVRDNEIICRICYRDVRADGGLPERITYRDSFYRITADINHPFHKKSPRDARKDTSGLLIIFL